ncbi:MAG TPA: hypothetical protein VL914_04015 [Vicinamibacterales bacterium]|jgi:hypothetical protein|nr:hypothetical protein [Vicinamibacterales bacterium]
MFDDSSSPQSKPTGIATPEETPAQSAAVQRYHSCRWRKAPEDGNPQDFCSHRDVQPMAGTTGFDAEAWCPDCQFYKVRRIPKKRSPEDYGY